MYNRDEFLDNGAKDTLAHHKREQEERKQSMLREQKRRELKQLETQLFYKKQEVARLKTLFERMRREAVTRESTSRKEKQDVLIGDRQVKDTETRIKQLDLEVVRMISEVNEKISREKIILQEHERNLEMLEKEKREIDTKKEYKKRTFSESLSRLLFFRKREEQEAKRAEQLFHTTQTQLKSTENSLKVFNQEVTVLENKIRSLNASNK